MASLARFLNLNVSLARFQILALLLFWAPDDEQERMMVLNRQMFRMNDQQSASTISQKWEQDARKDPEEEYFRLVSDATAKPSPNRSPILRSVRPCTELPGTEDHLQRAGHGLRLHSLPGQTLRQVQEAEDPLPPLVQLDREGAPEGERSAEEGRGGRVAPQVPTRAHLGLHFLDPQWAAVSAAH